MHLKFWIFVFLASAVACGRSLNFPARDETTNQEDKKKFVLVGASSTAPKITFGNNEDDKALRSAYYSMYPMMITHGHGNGHHHHPANSPNTSLLNLNLGLLEPFMLITFLLFVLCLIDKAKIISMARNEFDQNYYGGHSHLDMDGYPNFYIKRNSSEF